MIKSEIQRDTTNYQPRMQFKKSKGYSFFSYCSFILCLNFFFECRLLNSTDGGDLYDATYLVDSHMGKEGEQMLKELEKNTEIYGKLVNLACQSYSGKYKIMCIHKVISKFINYF